MVSKGYVVACLNVLQVGWLNDVAGWPSRR